MLQWVAIPFSSQPKGQIQVSCIAGKFLYHLSYQGSPSYLPGTLGNFPSPPGSSVHEILQARILEWVVIPFSRGLSQLRDQTRVSYVS